MEILAGLLSAGSGGLLGMVAGFVTNWFKAKEEAERLEADRKFKVLEWAQEKDLYAMQLQGKQQDHENEVEIIQQEGSWANLGTSIQADTSSNAFVHKWVMDIVKLYRPFLTTALVGIAGYIFYVLTHGTALQEYLTKNEISSLVVYVVESIIFSATTSVAWWFADRALSPPHRKNK